MTIDAVAEIARPWVMVGRSQPQEQPRPGKPGLGALRVLEAAAKPAIDDEYTPPTTESLLKLLKRVRAEPRFGKPYDLTEQIQSNFDYFARTRDLEIGTSRTAILEEILGKMLAGTDVKEFRVVIMRKGEEAEAFVCPDGTVFIGQSAINLAGSLDATGGILAHEAWHLVNKTFEKKVNAGETFTEFGVGWLHEMTGDLGTAPFLEKAGLNSLGGSWFFAKLAKTKENQRGIIHQSHLGRAAEIVGEHLGVDYTTSHQEAKPLGILEGKARPTNLEELEKAMTNHNTTRLTEIITKLHPRDFQAAYEALKDNCSAEQQLGLTSSVGLRVQKTADRGLEVWFKFLQQRLSAAGVTTADKQLFYLTWLSPHYLSLGFPKSVLKQAGIFPVSQAETKAFIDALPDFCMTEKYRFLSNLIFGSGGDEDRFFSNLENLLKFCLHDPDVIKMDGLPLPIENFLELLQKLAGMSADPKLIKYINKGLITGILLNYVDNVYLANIGKEPVDISQIKKLFSLVKKLQVPVDASSYQAKNYTSREKHIYGSTTHVDIPEANQQAVKAAFNEVFAETLTVPEAEIESFLTNLYSNRNSNLENFLAKVHEVFASVEATDAQRAEFLHKLKKRIFSSEEPFSARYNILANLATQEFRNDPFYRLSPQEAQTNDRLVRFNVALLLGAGLFQHDGPEFYAYLEDLMGEAQLDLAPMSAMQIFRLIQCLFPSVYNSFNERETAYDLNKFIPTRLPNYTNGIPVTDLPRFEQLPFVKSLLTKIDFRPAADLTELLTRTKNFVSQTGLEDGSATDTDCPLYSENLACVIMGGKIRQEFSRLLSSGVTEKDYPALREFLKLYWPEGVEKDAWIRNLDLQYLSSGTVETAQKIDYLLNNFEACGPEGLVLIAEELTTLADYRQFRARVTEKTKKYLEGDKNVSKLAAADFLTSFVTGNFANLLESAHQDPASQKRQSTKLAKHWVEYLFGYGWQREKTPALTFFPFDWQRKKFVMRERARNFFLSVSDTITKLHNLNPRERQTICHKALTDPDGALASETNRRKLGMKITKILNFKSRFISQALKETCLTADAEWLDFPTSRLLADLLFRAYEAQAIDVASVGRAQILADGWEKKLGSRLSMTEIKNLIHFPTDQLVIFGEEYAKFPDHPFTAMAQASEASYRTSQQQINLSLAHINADEKTGGSESIPQVDTNLEAIIRGVEGSGSLGVRSLQLARQLHRFSPAVAQRLSRCFDANPGLNKLLFWENLHKLSQNGDRALTDFIENRIVSVGEKLGAGSLNTTFSARVRAEDGQTKAAVLKMLNPNAAAFIKKSGEIAMNVLTAVADKSHGEDRDYAQLGQALVALSEEWCLRDINDLSFVEDDERFRQTIEAFNQERGETFFYAPPLEFNSYRLKSEDLAAGTTLNQFLQDPGVDTEKKKEVLIKLANFFKFQLQHVAGEENGKPLYQAHANLQVGNYIVGDQEGGLQIGVIDRAMFLHLDQQDVAALNTLLTENYPKFITQLVEIALDKNKIFNRFERQRIRTDINFALAKGYATQKATGHENQFTLLQIVQSKLVKHHAGVPLEMQLSITNFATIKELLGEYGLTMSG